MSVRFVAIVGPNNEQIYFKSSEKDQKELQINHQFIAEMSLDFIERQLSVMQSNLRSPLMVVLHDGIAVYAMLSNTKIKYIVGLESTKDTSHVGDVINEIVDVFIGYQCNPFGNKLGKIESRQFDDRILTIMES